MQPVSIIIPVYNVRPYLAEALDSVLCQSYGELEIIIVDDGSTDGSGEVCDSYAERDARIIVIHQENKGLSAARNVGLDRMTGDSVAFLDPDDAYHVDYVEGMLNAMVREDADLVISQFTVHGGAGSLRIKGNEIPEPSIAPGKYDRVAALRALANGTINVSVWNKLYRRKLWKNIRFPEGRVYEDVDTTYRILNLCETVYAMKQPLYYHRKRPGSITDTASMGNAKDRVWACSNYFRFIKENMPGIFTPDQLERAKSALINGMIAQYVYCFGIMGEKSDALRIQLLAQGKEIGVDTLNYRTRTAYSLLRYCPWSLRILYPVYRILRETVRKITGR